MFLNKIKIENNLILYKNDYKISDIEKVLKSGKARGIRIYCPFENDCKRIENLTFLQEISDLEEISILCNKPISFEFLYNIKTLKSLKIQTIFSDLDLEKLSDRLELLSINYNEFVINFGTLNKLKKLHIEFSKYQNIDFNSLNSLLHLSIDGLKTNNLELLRHLKALKSLRISNANNIHSLQDIVSLQNLEFIEFNNCKQLNNIENLSSLKNLKILELIDNNSIKSNFNFLKELKNIKQFSLINSKKNLIVDNENFNGIERVIINKYKNYSRGRLSFWNWSDWMW